MLERRKSALAREQLDVALAKLQPLAQNTRPVKGWLRAIRTGLGISGLEAARRLGVKPPRIVEMEKNELSGAITLKVLEKAAAALGCDLAYALIPKAGSLAAALHGSESQPEGGSALDWFDPDHAGLPLSPADALGLRLSHVATRGELQQWEAASLRAAEAWAAGNAVGEWPAEAGIRKLHGKLFAAVWKGAGTYRAADSDAGAPTREIAGRVAELCGNVRHWAKAGVYPEAEACARFYHRLWSIRPFDRGNGRLARLAANVLATRVYGLPRFSWGRAAGDAMPALRLRYTEALRAAAGRDYRPLAAFLSS